MFTREWSDWRNGWFLWLQSVYVLPEYRGRGVFRAMCDRVLQMAHDNPEVVGVRLYVHDENTRAQQVYRQAGFTDPQYRVLEKHTGD